MILMAGILVTSDDRTHCVDGPPGGSCMIYRDMLFIHVQTEFWPVSKVCLGAGASVVSKE